MFFKLHKLFIEVHLKWNSLIIYRFIIIFIAIVIIIIIVIIIVVIENSWPL